MVVAIDVQSFKPSKAKSKPLSVSDKAFATPFNEGLVHQVITSYLTCGRSGTYATKNRSDRSGGGAKPWRQKGTGRARAGTRTSPIWVGGGHTFARAPYDYTQAMKVNKKVYRQSLRCILSQRLQDGSLKVVDDIVCDTAKTKDFVATLSNLGISKGLFITDTPSENLILASRNIPNIYIVSPKKINPYMLVHAPQLILTKAACEFISEYLA